ncbi:hypothetical protein EDB83DRAFT_1191042 [Lactarius deliciosus]|nr:hypothetical protein EDB83DRAFT_1191042 [Lactarius deliciosus]
MSFLALANRLGLTQLTAAMGTNLLRTVRKPFALPLGISPLHRLAGMRPNFGLTTHSPRPDVGAQSWAGPLRTQRIFVLCFDGTGDQFDADNTNIVQFCSALKKDDASQQMVYYQPGVGTYSVPQVVTRVRARFQKYINMAIANHISAHVMSGYEFLMQNYRAMDKICIFGFSRGAYTARALAGMIHKVYIFPFAYEMYTREDEFGWQQSKHFKKAFSVDVRVDFLGAWDTVCSVGVIPHTLPFTNSNSAIRHFRHAMALDERRAAYQVNHWHPGNPHDPEAADNKKTDVREVWFAGCHSDVGGGSVPNETKNSLARISLRWMIHECFRTQTGIQFRRNALENLGIDVGTLRPAPLTPSVPTGHLNIHTTTQMTASTTEASTLATNEEEERADALSRMHDQLKMVKAWWILEWLPLRHRRQYHGYLRPKHYWSINMAHPREILRPTREGEKILVHRSVETRMKASESEMEAGKYMPKAGLDLRDVEWID